MEFKGVLNDDPAGTIPPAASGASGISVEKDAAVRELLRASHTLIHARQMAQAVVRHVGRNMTLSRPEQAERAHRMLSEEVDQVFAANVPRFADAMVPLYHKYFTHGEIDAMVSFYASELGQKLLEVMPHLMRETTVLTEQWARGLVPACYERVFTRLRAEGVDLQRK